MSWQKHSSTWTGTYLFLGGKHWLLQPQFRVASQSTHRCPWSLGRGCLLFRARICGRGAWRRKLGLISGHIKTFWKIEVWAAFFTNLSTTKIKFHHGHGSQPSWESAWKHPTFTITQVIQTFDLSFARFKFEHAKIIPKTFWLSDFLGRNVHAFCLFACCATWGSATYPVSGSTCMLDFYILNGSNRLPHVRIKSSLFWIQGAAHSHSIKFKKEWVVTPRQNWKIAHGRGWCHTFFTGSDRQR